MTTSGRMPTHHKEEQQFYSNIDQLSMYIPTAEEHKHYLAPPDYAYIELTNTNTALSLLPLPIPTVRSKIKVEKKRSCLRPRKVGPATLVFLLALTLALMVASAGLGWHLRGQHRLLSYFTITTTLFWMVLSLN